MKIYTPRKQATMPVPKANCPTCGKSGTKTKTKTKKR